MKIRFLFPLLLLAPTLSPAAVIIFQQGVTNGGAYSHLGQDYRGTGATNSGSDMLVGYQSGGVLQIRSALGFDLGLIPAGSQIDSISLVMTVNNTGSGTPAGLGTIEVREAIPNGVAANNMVEGQVTYSQWQTGSTWTTTGGDFGPVLTSASVVDANMNNLFTNGEQATFPTGAAFVTAAQNAFDSGLPLELILLSPTAEGTTGSSNFARFGSDDATTAANRPQLIVNFTIPEPGIAGLLLLGTAALAARRKR